MCGIVGFIGANPNANEILVSGLQSLEYRGYDSAGVALLQDTKIETIKTQGKVKRLKEKLQLNRTKKSTLGIAHTRWATHGIPNEANSHPHTQGMVSLVHNGIIENYHELKEELKAKGVVFKSETDTEVACALINDLYTITKDKHETLQQANQMMRGSFALAILFHDDIETLYAMRRNSPLIVAFGTDENYVASDVPAILQYSDQYALLEQDEYAILKKDKVNIYTLEGIQREYEVLTAEMDLVDIQKDGFEHFMLKEIHEEPKVVMHTIERYLKTNVNDLMETLPDLSKYNHIHMIACGSAMYASMIAKSLIETKARIRVEVEVASEYRYKNPILSKDTLVILVSQSGETADTLACLQLAKQNDIDTLAVVNVVGSSIAREAKYVVYTLAGPEIAVATTKAYCTQVALLALIALKLSMTHKLITQLEIDEIVTDIKNLEQVLAHLVKDIQYVVAAKIISRFNNVFFIGRGIDYALCMEASLKLKEISYIHSEAYPAGELKHGTISLVEKGTPIISVLTEETLVEKVVSNIKEVKARGANVIVFALEGIKIDQDLYDYKITIPKVSFYLQAITTIIPLQLLSYEVASLRGCEIDQPRNLAKSVTVE